MCARRWPLPLPTSAQTAAAAQVGLRACLGLRLLRTIAPLPLRLLALLCCGHITDAMSAALLPACQPLCLPPGLASSAGNQETLNYLFAADRDALRAMVSLMRSADMDAARLGLQASSHGAGGLHLLLP